MGADVQRWGLVSTIKAPAETILKFAAFHLDAGAHRLFLYLDAPSPEAEHFLRSHPKIRVFNCDDASWQQRRKKGGKPDKHQVRQTLNATRAYRRQARDVDWLAHIDVDEFLWADRPISEVLGTLSRDTLCARVRPIECLAGSETAFKRRFFRSDPEIEGHTSTPYPEFGDYLRGGFISHVQGKLFVRTGLDDLSLRIHNAYQSGIENPSQVELTGMDLCHLHAVSWEQWIRHYAYRVQKGSYRAELKPAHPGKHGGINLHQLLTTLEAGEGEAGLKRFFCEVCADSGDLRERLAKAGLLRLRELDLAAKCRKHFPNFPLTVP